MQILGFIPVIAAGLIMLVWGGTSLWARRRDRRLEELTPEYACLVCSDTLAHTHSPQELNEYCLGAIRMGIQAAEESRREDDAFYEAAVKEAEEEAKRNAEPPKPARRKRAKK